MSNKVSVNIYGKEYVVGGDRPAEQIMRIAAHVDLKMQQICGEDYNGPTSSLAILAAMNIAEEYYDLSASVEELQRAKNKLQADGHHYEQLWEEAKKSFVVYKEDSQAEIQALNDQKEELREKINEKDREIEEIKKNQKLVESEANRASEEAISQATKQYKDMENNFFDLQMENIQLKSELEKLRNRLKWEHDDSENDFGS
jgi:cell division protein ZapA (FtsZ GTPase activity inhibitor)